MLPRILTLVVDWVRAHWQFNVESATHGSATWLYIKTWKSGEFVRVVVALLDRYYGDPNSKLAVFGKILCAVSSGASLISLSGGSHTLKDYYKEYVGSGCTKTFVDYPFSICVASETVLSTNCISGLWDTRFLFNDKVQCYSLEAGSSNGN